MKSPIILAALLLLAKGCEVLAQRVDCLKQSRALCATSYLQPTGKISIPAVITPLISPVEPGLATPIVPSYADYGSYPCMPAMPPVIITRDDDDDWQNLMYFLIFALTRNRGGSGCGYSNGNGGCGYSNRNGGCAGNCGCGGNGYSGNYCNNNCYGGNGCSGNCYCRNGCNGNDCINYGYGDYGFGGGSGCGGVYAYDSFANFGGNYVNDGGYDVSNNGINLNNGGNGVVYVPYPIPMPMNSQYFGPSFPYPDNSPSTPDFYPSPGSTLPPCNCDCKDLNEITLTIKAADCPNNK